MEGESWFYPYKLEKPRNCGNLNVPFDFCNCLLDQTDISKETLFGEMIARYAVETMNAALVKHNHTHKCSMLKLNMTHPIEVIEIEPQLEFNAYKVTFMVSGEGWDVKYALGSPSIFMVNNIDRRNSLQRKYIIKRTL